MASKEISDGKGSRKSPHVKEKNTRKTAEKQLEQKKQKGEVWDKKKKGKVVPAPILLPLACEKNGEGFPPAN